MATETSKPLIFVSHSIENTGLTNDFLKRFERFNKDDFEIYSDRKEEAGDFNELILGKAQTCQIALLLISQSFIASNYCNEKEMPIFTERFRKNEVIIIPLLFQICNFEKWNSAFNLKLFQLRVEQLPNTRIPDRYKNEFNREYAAYEEVNERDFERYHKLLDFGHTPLQRRQVTDNTRAFLLDKFYSFC